MLDPSHPWYRPRWRRITLLLVTGLWGLVELATGNPGWALLFLALAGWIGWALILRYPPPGDAPKDDRR